MRLSLLILTAILVTFQATPTMYTPQNLIIATDLDNVVLRHRYGAIVISLLKNSRGLMSLYSSYRKNKEPYLSASRQWGEGFYLFLQDQKENRLAQKTVKMLNAKKRLHKKTVRTYKKMSEKGYKIYTASNVDTVSFAGLQKQFPHVFNDTFIQHGMTVNLSGTDVIKKPNLNYFEELKNKLNPNNDIHILFIDDLLENVQAARDAGLLAIQYKNPKQLQRELLTYGITLV